MIVLDTNVISELMRAQPASQVVAWLDAQDAESVWISSVSVLEIRYGIELVDDNARRLRLERAFDAMLRQDLSTRIVSFDVGGGGRESSAEVDVEGRVGLAHWRLSRLLC